MITAIFVIVEVFILLKNSLYYIIKGAFLLGNLDIMTSEP